MGSDGLYNPVTHIGVRKCSTEGVVSVETKVKVNCELPSRDSFCGYVPAAEASTAPEEWDNDNDEEQGWLDDNWERYVSQTV